MDDRYDEPVQDAWPERTCHGCGPANEDGIQLKSYLDGDEERLEATVEPDEIYGSSADNVANGGFLATLADCHSIWTATAFTYLEEDRDFLSDPPIYFVTGDLAIDYHAPTPTDEAIELEAWVDEYSGDEVTVHCEGGPGDRTTFEAEVTAIRQDDWAP